MPRVLKERTLHLFSEVIWTLCAIAPDSVTPSSLSTDFLQGVRQEVLKLFELESGKFSKGKQKATASYPPPGGISEGGQGKFSTYFQALLECFLATNAFQHRFHGAEDDISVSPSASGLQASSSPPPEPARKSSVRRLRARRGAKKDTSENDSKKKEEWLGIVRSASSVLTSLVASPNGPELQQLPGAHSEASLAGSLPVHPNSRVIVVTGIRANLPIEEAQTSIRRVCQSYGGLYNDQLYLPVEEVPLETKEEGEKTTAEGGKEQQDVSRDSSEPARGEGEREREGERQDTESSQPEQHKTQVTAPEHSTTAQPDTSSSTPQEQPGEQQHPESSRKPTHRLVGHAVLELRCSDHVSAISDALLGLQCLQSEEGGLAVTTVSNSLMCSEEETPNRALAEFLEQKLVVRGERLTEQARETLGAIYASSPVRMKEGSESEGVGLTVADVSGDLLLFFAGFGGSKGPGRDVAEAVWKEIGKGGRGGGGKKKGDSPRVSLEAFLQWSRTQAEGSPTLVWQGIFACGYDLHFTRYVCPSKAAQRVFYNSLFCFGRIYTFVISLSHTHACRCGYTPEAVPLHRTTMTQDQALVQHVDSLCRHLGTTSGSLQPWDVTLSEATLSSQQQAPLQGAPCVYAVSVAPCPSILGYTDHPRQLSRESAPLVRVSRGRLLRGSLSFVFSFVSGVSLSDLRLRFLQLKYINRQLHLLLPVTDLRSPHPLSLGARLSRLAPLLFYDVKLTFLHAVLNASTRRSLDQAPPEIKMDPLESLTGQSVCLSVCLSVIFSEANDGICCASNECSVAL